MIPDDVAHCIESSVLCWLATVSEKNVPNVSPKEAFLSDDRGKILVANIASPQTVRNIQQNENVSLSFVNIFIQKGYKITGHAKILKEGDDGFEEGRTKLKSITGESFKIISIIEITPLEIAPIIAPSYGLFPGTSELHRVKESLQSYSVEHFQKFAEEGGRDPLTDRSESEE